MTLTQEHSDFIKANMADWLVEQSTGRPAAVYEIELRERMVRVEAELKREHELTHVGFPRMDERFAQLDQRFELMDQRYLELRQDMPARFEQVRKRFEQVQRRLDRQDQRFETFDARCDEMMRRHDGHFLWPIGFITIVGTLIIGAGKFL
jgi:hypothetical protein